MPKKKIQRAVAESPARQAAPRGQTLEPPDPPWDEEGEVSRGSNRSRTAENAPDTGAQQTLDGSQGPDPYTGQRNAESRFEADPELPDDRIPAALKGKGPRRGPSPPPTPQPGPSGTRQDEELRRQGRWLRTFRKDMDSLARACDEADAE